MRLSSLPLLVPFVALACSRRAPPPPPRPVVLPERVAPPPTAARTVVAPPPPPVEGPISLALPGGVAVTGLTGRIDRLQIAAAGDTARLVAQLSGPGAPSRASTVSVDVSAAGSPAPPVTLVVGASDVRVVATVVAARGGLHTVAFGVRHTATEAADFGNAFRFVLRGPAGVMVRSEQQFVDVDELVAAGEHDRLVAAAVGSVLGCYTPQCEGSDRATSGLRYHSRAGFEAAVVLPINNTLLHQAVANVDCADPDTYAVPPTMVSSDDVAPDRCRAVRRERPIDVAIGVHGTRAFVAYRTATSVFGVAVTDEGVPLGTPVALSATGEVGAPTVAYRGDAVTVVWAQRDNARAPYSLRYIEWNRSDATPHPPVPRALVTGTASAFAPSLATVGDRRVLAWMEGDDRNAAVRVSSTAMEAEHLADHAVTVSATTAHARDPELAVSGDRVWMAWSEYAAGQRRDGGDGRVRVSPLRMP